MKNLLFLLLLSQIVTAQTKIPIHTELAYDINTPSMGDKPDGFQSYFDGKLEEYKDVNWDAIFKNKFERRYEFPAQENVTLNKIRAYSFQGGSETSPTRFYAITKDWQKILLAEFKGGAYKTWQEFTFPDVQPVYLIMDKGDAIPTELEFYGSYTNNYVRKQADLTTPSVPFKEMVGINMFSWNIVQNWATSYDPSKWAEISFIHSYRHYIGWETIEPSKGVYDFTGNWNLDAVYNKLLSEGKTVIVCIKNLPNYIQFSYPSPDLELNPCPYGSDLSDTLSYSDYANLWKAIATRYMGKGLIYEIGNETNKWWKGRNGYMTSREYAACLYACAKAIKEADPNAKVCIGGIADNNTDYFRGIIDWFKEYREGKLNFDALNYHVYASDANQQYASSKGVSPEQARVYENHLPHLTLAQQYGLKCFIGEIGYDHSPYSTQGPPSIDGFTIEQTVGNWNLRSMLLYQRAKLDGLQFYMWDNVTEDLNNGGVYATSGWHSGGGETFKYRATALYAKEALKILGNYRYERTLQHSPEIDEYDSAGVKRYVAWMPTSNNSSSPYSLSGFTFRTYNVNGVSETKDVITVTETPIFFDKIQLTALPIKERGKGKKPVKSNVKVYPNPTTDLVNLDKVREYTVQDMYGRILLRGKSKQLSLKRLASGIYFLSFFNEFGYKEVLKLERL